MNSSLDIVFISHGGGPLPLLGDPAMPTWWPDLANWPGGCAGPTPFAGKRPLGRRRTHRYRRRHPGLIYDYYGFPPNPMPSSTPAPASRHWRRGFSRR
ncbi:hypothetical protein MBH78_14555 [Oceanimonas sp. NS1]|nr:hypothetical protein [Oceanimonas sp. NS1]